MQRIAGHNHYTPLMRCLQLEEQWRRAQAAPSIWTMQGFTRVSKPLLRCGLRVAGWMVDAVLGRAKTIGAIAEYEAYCDDVDLVSFDVFDTLLYRTVEPPDYLKRRSANYAAQVLTGYGLPVHRELFLYVRGEEEARLRRHALASGWDSECKLSEIIHATVKSLCGAEIAERETDGLVQYEIDVECHHLRVAPGVPNLLSALQAKGKRIVAISDTYLETRHLELIFKRLGIERYFSFIYVSADHGIGKYRGRLFERVMQLERIGRQRMVHVGDNYESDVRAPIRNGLRAVFLRDKERLFRRRQARRLTAALISGRDTVESLLATPAQIYEGENWDLFLIGREVLGPAFSAFVLRVIEECYRWHVADVYFLAREGYLLRQIHELLVRNIHRFRKLIPIPVHYLYVSRLATSLPSLDLTEQRNLHLALFRKRDAGLDEALRTFGLTLADVKDLISPIDGERREATTELLADPRFVTQLQDLAGHARQRLKRYLAQEGFFGGGNVKALVDMGWNATIQANLTRGFYRAPDFPTVIGLYFGRRYTHEDDYALSSRSHFLPGVMFDERRLVESEHAIDRCVEIFEISASAPHGATVGYHDEGGVVKPALQDSPPRLTREQEILQAGILAHTEDFSQAYNDHELDTEVLLRHAAQRLRRFICRPTHREVMALRGVQHATDWGSQAFRPLIATELSLASVFSPNRLLTSLRHCCWPEGSLRHSGIPGGLFFLSVLRRSLRSRKNLREAARFCANLLSGKPRSRNVAAPLLIPNREIVTNDNKG
jgi:FMN phosphatase YigB (HAD superfamily)